MDSKSVVRAILCESLLRSANLRGEKDVTNGLYPLSSLDVNKRKVAPLGCVGAPSSSSVAAAEYDGGPEYRGGILWCAIFATQLRIMRCR
jgi:hypothetical protein